MLNIDRSRGLRLAVLIVAASMLTAAHAATAAPPSPPGTRTTTVLYDGFSKTGGYTLADYEAKWSNVYGPLEMANGDTRTFSRGKFNVLAAPFRTAADFSVYDHLKYLATSDQTFPVPAVGSVEISSTITAETPGTQPGRVVHGTYTASGLPYAQATLEGQQAGAVMNVIDFSTGQLFDWFISGGTAFALIERLPSNVTGNTSDPHSPEYVGRDQMYTQIIKETRVSPGAHDVSIRFSRGADGIGSVDYMLDGQRFATVDHVGIPLDVQGVNYTGTYPSLGPGEELGSQINSLTIGHGLFSLLDAFPFQHPEAPELHVSIPIEERIFGQGVKASFDDFKVKTTG